MTLQEMIKGWCFDFSCCNFLFDGLIGQGTFQTRCDTLLKYMLRGIFILSTAFVFSIEIKKHFVIITLPL